MRWCKALGFVLALSVVGGCAFGTHPTYRTVVLQRHDRDCLVAAVAMLGEWRYEDVDLARRVLGIDFQANGMAVSDGIRILDALGKPAVYDPPPDLSMLPQPTGILVISFPDRWWHAVFTERGVIYDPSIPYGQSWILWFVDRPESKVEGIVRLVEP